MVPDQRDMWNRKFAAGEHADFRGEPVAFAVEVERMFPPHAKVLDMGCGVGHDASYFARVGHSVLATDFSDVVIDQNNELIQQPGLEFAVADITEPIQSPADSFDVVYANLSLHYYDHETTVKVFKEIARVLKAGGIFAFSCKSPDDAENDNGQEVSPGVFVSAKGHIRHFFTTDYIKQLLDDLFVIRSIEEKQTTYIGKQASIIECVAIKPEVT